MDKRKATPSELLSALKAASLRLLVGSKIDLGRSPEALADEWESALDAARQYSDLSTAAIVAALDEAQQKADEITQKFIQAKGA